MSKKLTLAFFALISLNAFASPSYKCTFSYLYGENMKVEMKEDGAAGSLKGLVELKGDMKAVLVIFTEESAGTLMVLSVSNGSQHFLGNAIATYPIDAKSMKVYLTLPSVYDEGINVQYSASCKR